MMWIASRSDFWASVSVILRMPSRSASISTNSRFRPWPTAASRIASTSAWYSGVAVSTNTSSLVRWMGATWALVTTVGTAGSASARNSAPCIEGVASSVSWAAGLRSAESSRRASSSWSTGLRTKGAGWARAGVFLPGPTCACKVSSEERSERSVETGEDRIGNVRRPFGFECFTAGPAGIVSGAGAAFDGAALGAAAPACAPDVRNRAGSAFAVSAAEKGARLMLAPIGRPRCCARVLLVVVRITTGLQDARLRRT